MPRRPSDKNMSKVWRVGTNWDGTPLRDIFAKHKIAFAGQDVQRRMNEVEIGDLVGIGSGVRVIGVGPFPASANSPIPLCLIMRNLAVTWLH